MTSAKSEDREWHLDKKVPIALIFSIVVQTGVIVWWGARLDARVGNLEKGDEGRISQISQLTNIAVDIAALKERAQSTNNDISDIKRSVEMLTQQVLQEKTRR